MIKTFRVDIDGYGTSKLIKSRRGKVKNIWLSASSPVALQVSVIADGYRELVSDYSLVNDTVKLPITAQLKTRNLRAVIKSREEVKTQVIISVEYA